jgi:hypothetical protein
MVSIRAPTAAQGPAMVLLGFQGTDLPDDAAAPLPARITRKSNRRCTR